MERLKLEYKEEDRNNKKEKARKRNEKKKSRKNIGLQKGRKSSESEWKGRKEGIGRKKK